MPISCASDDLQWGLIELQGELHVQDEREGPTFPVGTLCQLDVVSITCAEPTACQACAESVSSVFCRKETPSS